MPQSKAHQKATNKWLSNERDRIAVIAPKGKKAELKTLAEAEVKSLNQYILDALAEHEANKKAPTE